MALRRLGSRKVSTAWPVPSLTWGRIRTLGSGKVGLKILDLGLDTTTATGKLMLNVLGSVAEFERAMMPGAAEGGDRQGQGRREIRW